MKVCCITNDVEPLSINGETHKDIAEQVVNTALPAVLALYKKYDVHATFFCLASFVEEYPDIIRQIQEDGHEVACHGYSHAHEQAFDVLTYEEQTYHLHKAKEIIEQYSHQPVVSFRAPALRVNADTPKALATVGYKVDSSISAQRLDMFMSLGSKHKLQWLKAPREIFNTQFDNLARRGNGTITEIGVSAFALPYIGTLMRICPFLVHCVRYCLYLETRKANAKVVNFLYHPSEAVKESEEEMKSTRRASSWIGHLFSDILRTHLKTKNLGPESLDLLEQELAFWKKKGYKYKTIRELAL